MRRKGEDYERVRSREVEGVAVFSYVSGSRLFERMSNEPAYPHMFSMLGGFLGGMQLVSNKQRSSPIDLLERGEKRSPPIRETDQCL